MAKVIKPASPTEASTTAPPHGHTPGATGLTTGSPELGKPTLTLTVSDLVDRIMWLVPYPPRASPSERIRHWSREGLIVPVDQEHDGPGKHRGYDDDAPYFVALIHLLADGGLLVVQKPLCSDLLSLARGLLVKFKQAKAAGKARPPLFIEIYFQPGRWPHFKAHDGAAKPPADTLCSTRFDLGSIFEGVYAEEQRIQVDSAAYRHPTNGQKNQRIEKGETRD